MSSAAEHFDAVIVGSGFGGSVMAYRLAEAGLSVCLLERGKAYPPNGFARSPYDLSKNFWDPSAGRYGLFNVWSFRRSGALVASGLGGGSLIYANVLLRKDESWFKDDLPDGSYREWPVGYKDLEDHYAAAERMLNAQQYPRGSAPFDSTPKMKAFETASKTLDSGDLKGEFLPLNLAVSFRRERVAKPDDDLPSNPPVVGGEIIEEFPNYHSETLGRVAPRSTCRLCGECDIGCNYGSKNTLDLTYLSAAIHQKTKPEIRTLCEVKRIEPTENNERRYKIDYCVHNPGEFGREAARTEQKITCRYLILAAGTFGTPYLLLKNAASLPRLSKRLGERYSVNGDLLSFISKSQEKRNGSSFPRRLDPSFGPVITSAIRFGDDLDRTDAGIGRGFYIQDGGHPYLMSWLAQMSGARGLLSRSIHFLKLFVKYRIGLSNDADLGAEISSLIGEASVSMSSMPVLAMGRDLPTGKLSLKGGFLDCDWAIDHSKAYFDRVRRAGRAIAKALDAEYVDNPSYRFNFKQVLTAHPLGGCAMGRSTDEGVADPFGEVFGHKGLFIADGSIMPGPVGPNPSLTIAAMSDRIAEKIIDQHRPGP